MANSVTNPTWIAKETGRRLLNKLVLANNVQRYYKDDFLAGGAKVGSTINLRLPDRVRTAEGQALQIQPLNDQTVPMSLTNQTQVARAWSLAMQTTDLQMVRSRYINPMADALANAIDLNGMLTVYKSVYNSVGTPGVVPNTNLTYLQAVAKLFKIGAPTGDLTAIMDSTAMITIANANFSLFNPSRKISDAYEEGEMANNVLGISRWIQAQNAPTHTYGTYGGTPLVNGAGQTGTSLVTDGWTATTTSLNEGDTFTIAGVNGINWQSYTSTGSLQTFVVKAKTTTDGSGNSTIVIQPPIITSGPLQTVDAAPANDAVITVTGASTVASSQGVIFDRDAVALAFVDFDKPAGNVTYERIRSDQSRLAFLMVSDHDIRTHQNITRVDALYGWAVPRPEFIIRVQG